MANNKLREALVKAQTALVICEWPDGTRMEGVAELLRQIAAALAEPVRNYEVGTMEELYGRYEKFCRSHFNNDGDNCLKCPFSQPTCKFAWAQMPYEEGGDK